MKKKVPDKSILKQEEYILAHRLRMQSVVLGKWWKQEHEVTGLTASTVRKKRNECYHSTALLPLLFLFYSRASTHGRTLPTFYVGPLSSIKTD